MHEVLHFADIAAGARPAVVPLALLTRVRARLRTNREFRVARRRADSELLHSRLPSPRLAWRVAELTADANRLELARALRQRVREADVRYLPSASPLNRVAVRANSAALLTLAARLEDLSRPVSARGVLLAERLLTDARGSLYGWGSEAGVGSVLDAVRAALEGR